MARTKIDYGIDLGTTNSAISRMENGDAIIKKTDTLKDTMPSCVSVNKKKAIRTLHLLISCTNELIILGLNFYLSKKFMKLISRQSKYKVNVSKKNILQIINQNRKIINRKQLLVPGSNLKFTQFLLTRKRSYKFFCFRFIYPRGMPIYDWHHRIQIEDLYPVTRKFALANVRTSSQKFHKAKANCYKASQVSYNLKRARTNLFTSTNRGFVLVPLFKLQLQGIIRRHTCIYNSSERKYRLNFIKRTILNKRIKSSFCFAKKRQKTKNNVLLSISGGQDSSFLLFSLSFLQFQIAFKPQIIWCNHFWQKSSFYTTLHLTKSAMAFSTPIIGFIPFHKATYPQLYQIVRTNFCSDRRTNVRTLLGPLPSYKSLEQSPPICTKGALNLCFVSRGIQNTFFISQKIVKRKKKQSKIFFFYKNIIKKQDKYNLYTKNNFYVAKIKKRKKKPKAYKKFIKEISETRARNWRHITIERAYTFYGSRLCLNGHTLSDRVETILFNLIRGTKKKNFQALPWKRRHSTFCYNRFYPTFEQVIKDTHIHFI